MYIFLISLLGIFLRLININKPEGLWNDEYVSWQVSATPFNEGFWNEVLKQCHMPLYYLYLKPFSAYSDLVLRLSSVIPSVIAIPVMYLVGKEYSKKCGYICAGITSVLPFLVYYAQEVRFYSLIFLFSALLLLYTIRLIHNKKSWCGFIVSAILILFTHVLGGIYVGLVCAFIFYKKKNISKKLLLSMVLLTILLIPFGTNILSMLPSSQWWGEFSYTNILFLFSDYFSPILTNNINAPKIFFYSKNILFINLLLIPTIFASINLISGIKQAKGIALVAILTIFSTAILALSGKIVFITKYTIEILPILILLIALGTKNKNSCLFLSIFIAFQIFSVFTPYYPAKILRAEGNNLAAEMLNSTHADKIIYTYYAPDRFSRYIKTEAKTAHISKINRFEYIDNPAKILNTVSIGENVSILFLDTVSFIPENWIQKAKNNHLPEMFISFSIIRNELIKELSKNYSDFDIKRNGSWTVINARKLK